MQRRVNVITVGIAAIAIISSTVGAIFIMSYSQKKSEKSSNIKAYNSENVSELASSSQKIELKYGVTIDNTSNVQESEQDIGYEKAGLIAAERIKEIFGTDISNAYVYASMGEGDYYNPRFNNFYHGLDKNYTIYIKFEGNSHETYSITLNSVTGDFMEATKDINFEMDKKSDSNTIETDPVLEKRYNYTKDDEEYVDNLSYDELKKAASEYVGPAQQYLVQYNLVPEGKLGKLKDFKEGKVLNVNTYNLSFRTTDGGEVDIALCKKTKELMSVIIVPSTIKVTQAITRFNGEFNEISDSSEEIEDSEDFFDSELCE